MEEQDRIIYRGMTRPALDAAYDNAAHVGQEMRSAYVSGWMKRAEIVRRSPGAQLDLAYGPGLRHRLDLLPCGRSAAPTLVYIHGGYWQWNDKVRDAFREKVCWPLVSILSSWNTRWLPQCEWIKSSAKCRRPWRG